MIPIGTTIAMPAPILERWSSSRSHAKLTVRGRSVHAVFSYLRAAALAPAACSTAGRCDARYSSAASAMHSASR
jgi:hypothetical protein